MYKLLSLLTFCNTRTLNSVGQVPRCKDQPGVLVAAIFRDTFLNTLPLIFGIYCYSMTYETSNLYCTFPMPHEILT
jgi:hypothetical protein